MTRYSKATGLFFLTALLFISSASSFAQQPNLQTSFFAPAAVRTPSPSVGATIVDTQHLPYLKELAKEAAPVRWCFTRPNPIF